MGHTNIKKLNNFKNKTEEEKGTTSWLFNFFEFNKEGTINKKGTKIVGLKRKLT